MIKKYRVVFIAFIFLLICASCEKKKKPENPAGAAVPVSVYKVTTQSVTGKDNYPGTVVAINEVQLRPQVAGYITSIFVKDGQAVTQGQKIYEIDRRKYEANYLQAQANMERGRKDMERYEHLLKANAVAKQQVDYAKAAYKTAEAQLSSAATDLEYSVIKAPFDGNIGISQVRIGSQVTPGQTLLNTISTNDPIAIDFVVNENEIPRFNRLIQTRAENDSVFSIILPDKSVYPYPVKIITMDRAVERQTGTIIVRLNTPNPKRQLIAGMSINIRVLNQDIGRKLVIPFKSVTEQMGEYFVYVIKGDSVTQNKVELGTRLNEKVVVREGLKEGETIVVDGVQRLRPGAKIQTGATSATTPPTGK